MRKGKQITASLPFVQSHAHHFSCINSLSCYTLQISTFIQFKSRCICFCTQFRIVIIHCERSGFLTCVHTNNETIVVFIIAYEFILARMGSLRSVEFVDVLHKVSNRFASCRSENEFFLAGLDDDLR